jgi:hypothetical protein
LQVNKRLGRPKIIPPWTAATDRFPPKAAVSAHLWRMLVSASYEMLPRLILRSESGTDATATDEGRLVLHHRVDIDNKQRAVLATHRRA